MNRRDLFKLSLAATSLIATSARAHEVCTSDGTPVQFVPKRAADSRPQENDIEKIPKCP